MTRRLAALTAAAMLSMMFWPVAKAVACPPPSAELRFHSCWGDGRLAVALLPEALPIPEAPEGGGRLIVTGAYTATDTREGGLPKPVGLFVHDGQVVNPNLGRMDGVLVVDSRGGAPALHHRTRLPLGGRIHDLTRLDERREFLSGAAAAELSVLQSHLLIVDGRVDVRQQDDAPIFVRRLLFTDADGFGVYQTRMAVTLRAAAEELASQLAPRMALNLDMGSYDYCREAVAGAETGCGVLGRNDTAKLSNLLILTLE
jgi:hypothetical protein